MSNDNLNSTETQNTQDIQEVQVSKPLATEDKSEVKSSGLSGIKFFGCCSKSLKRFSVLLFIINIFVSIGIMGALVITLFFKVGLDMLSFLVFPLVTVFIILILLARFLSALVYGFAEIVGKNEKK